MIANMGRPEAAGTPNFLKGNAIRAPPKPPKNLRKEKENALRAPKGRRKCQEFWTLLSYFFPLPDRTHAHTHVHDARTEIW